ncbi:MAG: hypothetical protein WCP21_00925 [Armatimonadota bacterium]
MDMVQLMKDTILPHFEQMRSDVRKAWWLAIGMSVLLYGLFIAMAVMAVVMSYITGKEAYGLIFGGVSVAQFLGTMIWKPYDNVLKATLAVEGMDIILVSLEVEWKACEDIPDPKEREQQIKAAGDAALTEANTLIDKLVPK